METIQEINKTVFGTKEWAENSFNCCNGCAHNCRYCYAKKIAMRYGRKKSSEDWQNEVITKKQTPRLNGKIMFPTTHDITEITINEVIKHINNFLKNGNELLIVSKPHFNQIKKLIENIPMSLFDNYKEKIMFRFSIGSTNNNVLKYWEPNAPEFEERLYCLQYVFEQGYQTSISSEPMLWIDQDALYNQTNEFITDSIWFGKLNNHSLFNEDKQFIEAIKINTSDKYIFDLYSKYKDNPKVKWKESIKKVVGLHIPTEKGLDI